MKIKTNYILIIAFVLILISCNEQKDNRLVNTCWDRYNVILYDSLLNPLDTIVPYTNEMSGFTFYFFEEEFILGGSKFDYQLSENKLIFAEDIKDIILFTDTLFIILSYTDNELEYPTYYEYYKRLNCDTLPKINPDTVMSIDREIFLHKLKYIFKSD